MALKLYNTLTRKKQAFKPILPGQVNMYSCGPTVYNYAHIGNYRAFMCSDLLKRYLVYRGYSVKHVMNITDVDDKTIRDSQKAGKALKEFTEFYTKAFLDDLHALNVIPAEIMPKATECIPEMVRLVKDLMDKGIAYKAKDGIYFDISKFKHYGRLSKIDLSQTKKGSRVCTDEYDKSNPNDFALWKFWDEKDGDVFWETEIGKGRPGWHIECSAMSSKYLGESFDIHTGGVDLIFPHHENEIAQSEASSGKKFVKYWFHNEYILVDGKKMSKSVGNFYTLRDLLQKGYSPKAARLLLLSTHYRQQLNFTLEGLKASENSIARLKEFIDKVKRISSSGKTGADEAEEKKTGKNVEKAVKETAKKFSTAMDDDLNISEALSALFEFVKEINIIMDSLSSKDAEDILKFTDNIDSVLGLMHFEEESIPKEIIHLAEERKSAKLAKDFRKADELREKIKQKGYSIDDTKEGYVVKKS